MIEAFTKAWFANLPIMREKFAAKHPDDYKEIVIAVVEMIASEIGDITAPDPKRIHEINDGDYQGTLVYVIPEQGLQPHRYWYVKVDYGSCNVCDTLEAIRNYGEEPPTDEQVRDYMTLALHIIQGLREMGDSDA